jgi:hypothetical protein
VLNISCDIARKIGTVDTDRPGDEIPKDYRKVVKYLIDSEGWSYKKPSGNGYPKILPSDMTQTPIKVPKTPSSQRTYSNWLAEIHRKAGTGHRRGGDRHGLGLVQHPR